MCKASSLINYRPAAETGKSEYIDHVDITAASGDGASGNSASFLLTWKVL